MVVATLDVVAEVEALDVATVVDVVAEVLDAVELEALVEDALVEEPLVDDALVEEEVVEDVPVEEEDVAEDVDVAVPDVAVEAVARVDVDAEVAPPVCPAPPLLVLDWLEHAPLVVSTRPAIQGSPRFTVSEGLTVGGSGEWDIRDPAPAYIGASSGRVPRGPPPAQPPHMSRARWSALIFGLVTLAGTSGCSVDSSDGMTPEEEQSLADAITTPEFVRSDQVSFGRAPANTTELQALVHRDFSDPVSDANKVIAWIDAHPNAHDSVYLGDVQTWVYDVDATYRANVHTLVSHIHAHAPDKRLLLYFEEQNATHSRHQVSAAHGPALRTLAGSATLLCATYLNGRDSHTDEIDIVMSWRKHYHDELGVPLKSMIIDVDTSQTPSSFYYGSRGQLANFDHVIVWALNSAYAHGFAGFHTYGNVGGHFGTLRAADSTYAALDKGWEALVKAHPHQKFTGI